MRWACATWTFDPPAALRRASIAGFIAVVAAWIGVALPARAVDSDRPTQRLIVKFKDDAPASALPVHSRIALLAAAGDVALHSLRPMALGAHVVILDRPIALSEARAIARRLAAHPDVEYVVPDRRMRAHLVPNDPFLSSQTYLPNTPAAISAFAAWDTTTGSQNTVVAVVDTGYRPHAGLSGRFLGGYDFISDPATANDGGGRDPDATDPGDWVTEDDIQGPLKGQGCTVDSSSWHGTAVASVIAANSNDAAWSAGINWAAMVLPVRVLGKCGGWFSDIIDGVAWAAGLSVPGVPANPHPAQIINMSLGDTDQGACTPDVQSVIDAALAQGVTRAIVVSAGNDSEDVAGHSPANCSGVISVAATDIVGSRASYSNFGATVTISAPGGGRTQAGDRIFVLANNGTTDPTTDNSEFITGTSFSAPMVSGVVSLMLAVAPNLTAAQVRAALTSSAKPFPFASTCSTAICGAGIVNAQGAVQAAQSAAGALVDLNQHGLTGSWFQQATSGQGLEVEVFPDFVAPGTGFAQLSWFTFDPAAGGADHQRWYTLSGPVVSGQPIASLKIYQNAGGNFNAPPVTMAQPVGTAMLSFDTCISGLLSYNFTDGSGRTGAMQLLTRLTQNVTCSMTTARPSNADFALSGNWYGGAATSGQGFTAEVNPNSGTFFSAWYTYAPMGADAGAAGQRWYTAQGAFMPGQRSIPVTIYETTGGIFDTPTPPGQQTVAVGTGTMAFQSCSAAMFSYNFTGGASIGLAGTINLSRVGPVPQGCTP